MIRLFDLDWYLENIRILGVIAILIGVGTWVMDLTGAVYICPFCRAQRTVILILGIFMTTPGASHFILKYATSILGVYGLIVASNQHFRGWVAIQRGERGLPGGAGYAEHKQRVCRVRNMGRGASTQQ